MDQLKDFLNNKKNLISLLTFAILALALPLLLNLIKTQKIFFSRATPQATIEFTGTNVFNKLGGGKAFQLNSQGQAMVTLAIISPLGPPEGATSTSSVQTLVPKLVGTVYANHCETGETNVSYCENYHYCTNDADCGHTCYPIEKGTCGAVCNPGEQEGGCTNNASNCPVGTGEKWVNQCSDDGTHTFFVGNVCSENCPYKPIGGGGGGFKCVGTTCTPASDGSLPAGCNNTCGGSTGKCSESSFTDKCSNSKTFSGACQELKNSGWNGDCNTASCSDIKTAYNNTVKCGGTSQGNTKLYVEPGSISAGQKITVTATGSDACSTGITDPPTVSPGGGYSGCSVVPGSYTCGGGNPKDSNKCWWQWSCIAGSAGSYKASFNASGTTCQSSADFTVSGTTQTSTTKFIRIAESVAGLADANNQFNYSQEPFVKDFTFSDTTAGVKTVFVQFVASDGTLSSPADQKSIELVFKPQITGCLPDVSGAQTSFEIAGTNFGSQRGSGEVKLGGTSIQAGNWKDNKITTNPQSLQAGQVFNISVKNDGGLISDEVACSSVFPLAISAKFFCGITQKIDQDNVALTLVGTVGVGGTGSVGVGGTPPGKAFHAKVKINKDGTIQGLTANLVEGQTYKLALKALKALRKVVSFTARPGTTNLPDVSLPIGDIFPTDSGDGSINSADKAELNRQWRLSSASTNARSGDFNLDGLVNSFDWACMRQNFNISEDAEPQGQ